MASISFAQIQELKARNLTQRETARTLGCSLSTVAHKWNLGVTVAAPVTRRARIVAHPDSSTLSVPEARTTRRGFEGIADHVVAGSNTDWLAWDGELRPVIPGTTGKDWKIEQRALQVRHTRPVHEDATPVALQDANATPDVQRCIATEPTDTIAIASPVAPPDQFAYPVRMSPSYQRRIEPVNRFNATWQWLCGLEYAGFWAGLVVFLILWSLVFWGR